MINLTVSKLIIALTSCFILQMESQHPFPPESIYTCPRSHLIHTHKNKQLTSLLSSLSLHITQPVDTPSKRRGQQKKNTQRQKGKQVVALLRTRPSPHFTCRTRNAGVTWSLSQSTEEHIKNIKKTQLNPLFLSSKGEYFCVKIRRKPAWQVSTKRERERSHNWKKQDQT